MSKLPELTKHKGRYRGTNNLGGDTYGPDYYDVKEVDDYISAVEARLEQKDKEIEVSENYVGALIKGLEKLKARNEKLERVVDVTNRMRNCKGTAINSMPILEAEFDEALSQLNEVDDQLVKESDDGMA